MEYLTTSEMAEKWNISRRRLSTLCKEGRIEGAICKGRTWLVPADTLKPEDMRKVKQSEESSTD